MPTHLDNLSLNWGVHWQVYQAHLLRSLKAIVCFVPLLPPVWLVNWKQKKNAEKKQIWVNYTRGTYQHILFEVRGVTMTGHVKNILRHGRNITADYHLQACAPSPCNANQLITSEISSTYLCSFVGVGCCFGWHRGLVFGFGFWLLAFGMAWMEDFWFLLLASRSGRERPGPGTPGSGNASPSPSHLLSSLLLISLIICFWKWCSE